MESMHTFWNAWQTGWFLFQALQLRGSNHVQALPCTFALLRLPTLLANFSVYKKIATALNAIVFTKSHHGFLLQCILAPPTNDTLRIDTLDTHDEQMLRLRREIGSVLKRTTRIIQSPDVSPPQIEHLSPITSHSHLWPLTSHLSPLRVPRPSLLSHLTLTYQYRLSSWLSL